MLSKKSKYALKACLFLAEEYNKGPILISDIAQKEKIPQKFLELILLDLKKRGILQSKKGKGGGYFLRKPPDEVTFGQIIRIFDGPLAPTPCVSETAYMKCEECIDESKCAIKIIMKEVRDAIAGILDKVSLSDALYQLKRKDKFFE